MLVGEAFIPRIEIVGAPRKHIHKIKKGPEIKKFGHPYVSRVIKGLNDVRAEVRYVALPGISADDIDTKSLPHVTREAARAVLADAAFEGNSLDSALKRKTAKPYSPVKAEDRSDRPLRVRQNATVYDRNKMKEVRARNKLKKMFFNGEINFYQLSFIAWCTTALGETNFTEPELPSRPFPNKKLENLNPKLLKEMRRQHKRERMARQGNVYTR